MSILSTNTKLVKVGQEYSAGSGISIDDYVISVTGDVGGKTYSAGNNISIYEQDNQLYISGKDWEQDIEQASANAYNAATAQIPTPFDPTYISAQIDNKLNESDFTAWQSGQYSTDLQTIEGQIANKLDSSSFSDVSGNFLTAINIPESATWNETSNVVKEGSANWDNTSDVVKESSASWNQGKTYEGISPIVVNNDENIVSADTWTFSAGSNVSFVDDNVNKITRIDVELPQPQDLSYISAQTDKANQGVDYLSGVVITAMPSDMATTGDVAELAQTISETYQTKGDYLVRSDSANFYPTNNPSGFITGVDLSNYYTKDETSGKEELANAFANIPVGDPEVNAYVTSHSASTDESTNLVQSNSSTWNDVTAYQSNSANYLTAIDIPESATWNETSNVVQSNSAQWSEGGAGDEEVNSFVYNNSATINEVNTTYQENSGAYLTAVDLTPYQTIEGMTAYQPVSSMTSYANRFQLISVSSNLSAAIESLDESITTGVVGNLHNYDIKGLNLYGVTSTSSYNSTGYVPSFTSNVASHNSDGQTNVWGLETANMSQWNGKPYVSISSNGNNITGNYKCKVFYLFDGIANKSWQSQNPFSGEIGTLDKDNLIVYNNYVKPSYFTNNGISNFNTKVVFSSNDGGYHPFDVVLTFGDLGVTGTNTISGIFVPSAADLSNYYKKTETSSKQEISNAVNNLFNYFSDANQYVQSNSGRIDFAVESYFTSGGLFLDCYNNVNTNSGAWGQGGNPEVESYVQTNSANIDDTVTSYQTNSGDYLKESELGYNAVDEVSAINGSAIAQYGAEKQWLVHDDTLVHASNSAQYALGCNISALQRLMGIDETVLWSGARQTTGTIQLSESMWNYNTMDIYVCPDYNTYSTRMGYQITRLMVIPQIYNNDQLLCYAKSNRIASNTYLSELFYLRFNQDGSSVDFSPGIKWSNNTVTTGVTAFTGAVTKIVGIGRKQ